MSSQNEHLPIERERVVDEDRPAGLRRNKKPIDSSVHPFQARNYLSKFCPLLFLQVQVVPTRSFRAVYLCPRIKSEQHTST